MISLCSMLVLLLTNGVNDLRLLLSEFARLNEQSTPLLIQLGLASVQNVNYDSDLSERIDQIPQRGLPWEHNHENNNESSPDNRDVSNEQLCLLAQELCHVIDRFGSIIFDLVPQLWTLVNRNIHPQSAAPAPTNQLVGRFNSIESRLLSLLRERSPSPHQAPTNKNPKNTKNNENQEHNQLNDHISRDSDDYSAYLLHFPENEEEQEDEEEDNQENEDYLEIQLCEDREEEDHQDFNNYPTFLPLPSTNNRSQQSTSPNHNNPNNNNKNVFDETQLPYWNLPNERLNQKYFARQEEETRPHLTFLSLFSFPRSSFMNLETLSFEMYFVFGLFFRLIFPMLYPISIVKSTKPRYFLNRKSFFFRIFCLVALLHVGDGLLITPISQRILKQSISKLRVFSNSYQEKSRDFFEKNLPQYPKQKQLKDEYTIINAPEITLKHPMVSIDIPAIARIVYSSTSKPDHRKKQFYAIVSGMGKGKTRLLVDLDREFKRSYQDAISISITFNSHWSDLGPFLTIGEDINSLNFFLHIMSRMISVYYQVSFDDAIEILKKSDFLTIVSGLSGYKIILVFQEFIRFLVTQARDNDRKISKFILSIDELKMAYEKFGEDPISRLRNSLLDKQLMSDENPLDIELIVSTLALNSLGLTPSSRNARKISPSDDLSAEKILEKWIPSYLKITFEDNTYDRYRFLLFISVFSPIPRAIEFLISSMLKYDQTILKITPEIIKELFLNVKDLLVSYYGSSSANIPPHITKAILFQNTINVDDTLMQLIVNSIVVNSFSGFKPDKEQIIKPKTSIVSFLFFEKENDFIYDPIINTIKMLVDELSDANVSKTHLAGRSLERIAETLILSKLSTIQALATKNDKKEFITIKELFQIPGTRQFPSNKVSTSIVFNPHEEQQTSNLCCSYLENESGINPNFLKEAANIYLEDKTSFKVIKQHQNECFDTCLLLRTPDNKPFALIIDCKSSQIDINNEPSDLIPTSQYDSKQSQRVFNISMEAETYLKNSSDINEMSLLNTLASKNYLYVYINTNQRIQTYHNGSNVLYLASNPEDPKNPEESDVYRFLSFFGNFARLLRTMINEKSK